MLWCVIYGPPCILPHCSWMPGLTLPQNPKGASSPNLLSQFPRLGVKSKLFRSSWRAVGSILTLMIFLASLRELLFACPPFAPCNPSYFTVERTLSSLCSLSDPLLFRHGAALAYLDSFPSHDLVIWTDGSVSFSLDKGGSGVLANCSLYGAEATFRFRLVKFVKVFQLKPAPFCQLSAGLGNTNKTAISFLFFSLTLPLSSTHCPLLHLSFCYNLSGTFGSNCLLSSSLL